MKGAFENGSSTVNLSPTSQEGKALVASMIRNGVVGETIQQSKSGKNEYKIIL